MPRILLDYLYLVFDAIRVIDIETGRMLWQDVLPAGRQAAPRGTS